jgi:1-acyl-sn-glycerol-3-phosphate acyltransferase
VPDLGAEKREALTHAGWWFPEDDPNLRPLGRYQEGKLAFRALTEGELEILQVGMFALRTMFGETIHSVDVTRAGVIGSWTLKLSGDRTAHVELRWPADPVKGLAFFLPENTEHFVRHRDKILRRLGLLR